jgi:plasmid stability protein
MSAMDTGFRRYDKIYVANDPQQMPDLLLPNVPQHIVDALKRQAAAHGRTVEAEHPMILEGATRAGFWERAAALREETRGRILTPSEELIRQDRDER